MTQGSTMEIPEVQFFLEFLSGRPLVCSVTRRRSTQRQKLVTGSSHAGGCAASGAAGVDDAENV